MKTLLADSALLKLEKIMLRKDSIILQVRTRTKAATCPSCHQRSERIHSRYSRCLADLPWEGIAVRLHLRARKFFCRQESCPQQLFCERLLSVAAPYARNTVRRHQALTLIGL